MQWWAAIEMQRQAQHARHSSERDRSSLLIHEKKVTYIKYTKKYQKNTPQRCTTAWGWVSKKLQETAACPFSPHESRRSMISLISQKHPCATEMSVSNSPCILEEIKFSQGWWPSRICWTGIPCEQQFNFRTLGGGQRSRKGTRWPSILAICPWKFTESGLNQKINDKNR